MQPIDSTTGAIALFGSAGTRVIELRAQAMLPAHTLMRRAGAAVARLALALAPHARRVWVAAGPGNNGGDGLEAALSLRQRGKDAGVMLFGDPKALPADASAALGRAQQAGVAIDVTPQSFDRHDIAIDALLGLGGSRAPQGALAEAVRLLNALACPVLAVDVPSGLNADTGQPFGADCVAAQHTLALLTLKPGLFTAAGRDHAGRVWLDRLGVDAQVDDAPDAWLRGSGSVLPRESARLQATHKGSFGDVAVVGGAQGMGGAAVLAARAAHGAGAGRVYVVLLRDALDNAFDLDPMRPELMFRAGWCDASPPAVVAQTTVVCGCGAGAAVRAPLPRLLSLASRLVLDADALNAIAADPSLRAAVRSRTARGLQTVLTPHPLEASRLLDCTTAKVQADRRAAARELAQRYGCVAVLKGSGTVVAAPGLAPAINATGNAALASAGTGDVLAGWIGGLWAQAPAHPGATDAFEIAIRAVIEHGAAAEPERHGPLRAADLVEVLHRRLRRLG